MMITQNIRKLKPDGPEVSPCWSTCGGKKHTREKLKLVQSYIFFAHGWSLSTFERERPLFLFALRKLLFCLQ